MSWQLRIRHCIRYISSPLQYKKAAYKGVLKVLYEQTRIECIGSSVSGVLAALYKCIDSSI